MSGGSLSGSRLEGVSQDIRALTRRLASDDSTAEDLAQEALVSALEQPAGTTLDLDRWLSRVVRHLAYRQFRRDALRLDADTRDKGSVVMGVALADQELFVVLQDPSWGGWNSSCSPSMADDRLMLVGA